MQREIETETEKMEKETVIGKETERQRLRQRKRHRKRNTKRRQRNKIKEK